MADIRLSTVHPVSGLQALVEDDGHSVWLYLRDQNATGIQADCWLYNRRPFQRAELSQWPRDQPPPAPSDLVGPEACWTAPLPETADFTWAPDGRSVAVIIGGTTLGYIAAGDRRGHSRYLQAKGPWGAPFDPAMYARLFGEPAA